MLCKEFYEFINELITKKNLSSALISQSELTFFKTKGGLFSLKLWRPDTGIMLPVSKGRVHTVLAETLYRIQVKVV